MPEDDGYIRYLNRLRKTGHMLLAAIPPARAGDYFTAQVLDNMTGEQVAVLRSRFDEDLYAKQIFCLGRYYNNALVGIESNFSTYPVRELARYGYPRQYIREREDTFTGAVIRAFGFKTTAGYGRLSYWPS